MKRLLLSEFKAGRIFVGSLPHGKDLIASIEEFCREASIEMATFSVIGALSSVTAGSYDQKQQVYVTFSNEALFEIAACIGNVSIKDGDCTVHAHILLVDKEGEAVGGHLFSESIVFAAEIELQELTGKPMERAYDRTTGLMLWKMGNKRLKCN